MPSGGPDTSTSRPRPSGSSMIVMTASVPQSRRIVHVSPSGRPGRGRRSCLERGRPAWAGEGLPRLGLGGSWKYLVLSVAVGVERMSPGTIGPRIGSPHELGDVVAILVSAFRDDPTWTWAFPDPSLRTGQLSRLWGLFVEGAMRFPSVWLTPGNTATSVWIPPQGRDLSTEQEKALEPTLVEMLGADASRVMHALAMFEQAHPRAVPHFYLSLLGTDVEHRGHGYGRGLL